MAHLTQDDCQEMIDIDEYFASIDHPLNALDLAFMFGVSAQTVLKVLNKTYTVFTPKKHYRTPATHCRNKHLYEGDSYVLYTDVQGRTSRKCQICSAEYESRYIRIRKKKAR